MKKTLREQWRLEKWQVLDSLKLGADDERNYPEHLYREWLKERRVAKHIDQAIAVEPDADIGYMARAMVQATLPHSKPTGNEYTRVNGNYRLTLLAPSDTGLPYGVIPRLLLAWLTSEAVKTKKREIELGDSLSEFMRELGMVPTGGRWGSIRRLREQCIRLFSTSITASYTDGSQKSIRNANIAESADLYWWDADPQQAGLWRSVVTLSPAFFNEITTRPVPISMDVIRHIKKSPLALDIYYWLTYRVSNQKDPTVIPWPTVAAFIGSEYERVRDFKSAFSQELKKVMLYYSTVEVYPTDQGLIVCPSPTHVSRKSAKALELSQK
jgi:hypothetical protein